MNIYETLQEYSKRDIIPMHMPGHKRNPRFVMENPYSIDVTEVEGLDDLHHPMGMIREWMDGIRSIYKTEESYLLVNGSTCGILAAVSACCRRGDRILMDRNCHRSVYHAVYLLELEPVYLYRNADPETGIPLEISVKQVREELTGKDFSCVVLTSPTYEGVMSDVAGIAALVHERGIPLIVDQAHGAHLHWCRMQSAVTHADLVVESLHKTLPALTQTGILHVCSRRVEREQIERYLDIYETSSPSYVLMASASQCLKWMREESGDFLYAYGRNLNKFTADSAEWKHLRLWQHAAKDPGKLVICTLPGIMSGPELGKMLLQQYGIQVEMTAAGYVIAMTSLCDRQENFDRLSQALAEIDTGLEKDRELKKDREMEIGCDDDGCAGEREGREEQKDREDRPDYCLPLYTAMNSPRERCPLEESRQRISAEYAFLYPPGIPFLVPGERITDHVVKKIQAAGRAGLEVSGLQDGSAEQIWVVRE